MKNKKILIIGGAGFIGHYLAKKCIKNNYTVTSLSLNKPSKERKIKKVKYIICDVSNNKELKKKIKKSFDIVVNLGGYIDHINKSKTYRAHYLGCKNLTNLFCKTKIKIFIQIGSSSEYGKIKSPHNENALCKPTEIYGYSKLSATKFLMKFKKKLPFVILRFYQVYGPKQKTNRMIPHVVSCAKKNLSFDCSEGIQSRDFLYIDDAVEAIYKCFNTKAILGKIINIGSGRLVNIKYLIKYIVKKIGKGKPNYGKIKLRADEPLISFPSIIRSRKYLGWKEKTSFEIGLKKTINYYK
tara:strand:+ start:309 stop:1199 length:891 start_codon:yes stop_codon:yes gene_type:complete